MTILAEPGVQCVYTLLLNDGGGVEADLTVTRLGEEAWYLVTSAAATEHVLAWLEAGLEGEVRSVTACLLQPY